MVYRVGLLPYYLAAEDVYDTINLKYREQGFNLRVITAENLCSIMENHACDSGLGGVMPNDAVEPDVVGYFSA